MGCGFGGCIFLLFTGCKSVNEKEEFYELTCKVARSEALLGGDVNGHVSNMCGFGDVYGGFWDWTNK